MKILLFIITLVFGCIVFFKNKNKKTDYQLTMQ